MGKLAILLIGAFISSIAHAGGSNGTAMGFTMMANSIKNNGWGAPKQSRITTYPIDEAPAADQFFNKLPRSLGGDQYEPCHAGWQQITAYCTQKYKERDEWRKQQEYNEQNGIAVPIIGADASQYMQAPESSQETVEGAEGEENYQAPTQLSDSGDLGDQA